MGQVHWYAVHAAHRAGASLQAFSAQAHAAALDIVQQPPTASTHPPVSGWLLGTMPSMPGGSSSPPTWGVSPVDSSVPPADITPAATTAGVGAGAEAGRGGRPGGSEAPAAVLRC